MKIEIYGPYAKKRRIALFSLGFEVCRYMFGLGLGPWLIKFDWRQ